MAGAGTGRYRVARTDDRDTVSEYRGAFFLIRGDEHGTTTKARDYA